MTAPAPRHAEIRPWPGPVGAEVRCGDVRCLDDSAFAEVHRAWLHHLVLVFPGQTLSDRDLARFIARFSAGEGGSSGDGAGRRCGQVQVVSNVERDGAPIGILGHGEVMWHSDMVAFERPPGASVLYALEVPPRGGDTTFNNMYLAYDALPRGLRRRLLGLSIKHEVRADSAGPGTGAVHPCVSTHPETGCNALLLGSRFNTYFTGLPRPESERLMELVWAHATQPALGGRHRWHAGDLLVWDNRCLLHRRDPFDPGSRRILHRTQVEGTVRPATAPDPLSRAPHPRGLAGTAS